MRACSISATVPAPRVRGSPRTTGTRPSPFATPTPVRGRRAAVSFAQRAAPRLEGLAEPEPDPALPAERALADGKHVLVAVDAKGARVYRTLLSSDATRPPERLVPLIRYNDSSKYDEKKSDPTETRRNKKASHLPDAIARAVLEKLAEIDPDTVLVAAHGKGKGDAARALVSFLGKHDRNLAARVVGEAIHVESEKGGRRLSDRQLLATARRAYRRVLAPRIPLEPQKRGFTHGRRVRHV
jgi:hypothetical protein